MDEHARRHFAAIGRAMADEAQQRRREAVTGDPLARVQRGLRLAEAFIGRDPAIEAAADRSAIDQAELHRRWRRIERARR